MALVPAEAVMPGSVINSQKDSLVYLAKGPAAYGPAHLLRPTDRRRSDRWKPGGQDRKTRRPVGSGREGTAKAAHLGERKGVRKWKSLLCACVTEPVSFTERRLERRSEGGVGGAPLSPATKTQDWALTGSTEPEAAVSFHSPEEPADGGKPHLDS